MNGKGAENVCFKTLIYSPVRQRLPTVTPF